MSSISVRRNRGGPQVESLRETGDLRPTASPQSIYSFDAKHSDFVERPSWGPNGWERLSAALSRLNPMLNQMAAHKEQEFYEEQTATGQELMHRNKVSWAEFIKTNPEYAGLNPHLERGYKGAELSSKAQDFQAALQDFYTTGGLMSEAGDGKTRPASRLHHRLHPGYHPEHLQPTGLLRSPGHHRRPGHEPDGRDGSLRRATLPSGCRY